MKILLLGYRGMLGSALFLTLSAFHEVTGKSSTELDIRSEEACRKVITSAAPDVVINAAGYTNVDGCETEGEKCFAVNAQGVKNIALACRGTAIKIVHLSTDYVFDGYKGTPYEETDDCHPLNSYGRSKLEGERHLETFSDNFIIIRTSWLYGKNGRNFVKTILEGVRAVRTLDVVTDQIGSPTYAGDLAAAIKVLIEGDHRGVFHIANSGYCSWYEFTLEILQSAGIGNVTVVPITSDKLNRAAARPAYSVLDCRKFFFLTGQTMRPWPEAVRAYITSRGQRTA